MDNSKYEYIVGENEQFNYVLLLDAQSAGGKEYHLSFCLERNAQASVEILYSALSFDTFFEAKNTQDERGEKSIFGSHVSSSSPLVLSAASSGVSKEAVIFIEAFLIGEGASISINSAYLLDETHILRLRTVQHHQAAHTSSTLMIKGLLRDSAQAHYHGTIRVEQDARGSVASQNNKNMLMSNNARAVSVPSLEVLTNEVQCFHGSASGRCDDEQLFYLQSRGIDKKQAHRLLLQAFFAGLFVDQTLNDKIDVLIGKH